MTEPIPPAAPEPEEKKRSRKWLWLAGGAIVLLIIIVASAGGDDQTSETTVAEAGNTSTSPTSGSETTVAEGSETTVAETTVAETTVPTESEDLTAEVGFTSSDSSGTRNTSAAALITNPNTDAAYDVTAVFNLLGADGTVLDTSSETVEYIPADSTVPVAPLQIGFDIPEAPETLEVELVGTFAEDVGWEGASFLFGEGVDLEVTDPSLAPDDFGIQTLSFTVTNPSDTLIELGSWDCVFRSGGAVVGGETSSIVDPIVPGGTVQVDAFLSVDEISADEILCRAWG